MHFIDVELHLGQGDVCPVDRRIVVSSCLKKLDKLDFADITGARRPQRDVIIALEITYRLERVGVDEFLLLVILPPLRRSALTDLNHLWMGKY